MKKRILAIICAAAVSVLNIFGMVGASADVTQNSPLVEWGYITSVKPGNIFTNSDTVAFTQEIKNKTSQSIVSNYSWVITDEEGNNAGSFSGTDNLSANEKKERNITVNNPGKYGIYTINVTEENYAVNAPGTTYTDTYSEEFSVCISLSSANIDEGFGFNQTIVNGGKFGLDDYQTSVNLMKKAGAKWYRESVLWDGVEPEVHTKPEEEYVDGKYIKLDPYKEKLRNMKDSGIKTVCVLTGRNSLYDNDNAPTSQEAVAAYVNFCTYVAEEFSGLVDYYEIWNEWNVTNFNPSRESPEAYANLLKAAYTAIKRVDSDICVIGCDTSGILPNWVENNITSNWMERVFAALDGGTYMDALSVHCYDYTTLGGFPETQVIDKVDDLKTLMSEYNIDVPVWLTEVGFSTYENNDSSYHFFVESCTRDVQLNSLVMLSAVNKANGLFDKVIQYCLYDNANLPSGEANWGLLNRWDRVEDSERPEAKLLPHGAKPSYLGIAAMNYFIGGNTEFRSVTKDENTRSYVFEFYNNNLNDNVFLAINGGPDNTVTKEIHVGSKNISIYDKYGNLKGQMNSDTGNYEIQTYSEPIYIVGNSTEYDANYSDMSLQASVDINTQTVTITGETQEPNDIVSLMVVTKGTEVTAYDSSKVHYLAQTVSDSEGDFSVQFNADPSEDTYRIYANTEKRRSRVAMNMVFEYTVPRVTVINDNTQVTEMTGLTAGDTATVRIAGFETEAANSPKVAVAQYEGTKLKNIKWVSAAGKFMSLGNEFTADFTVGAGTDRIMIVFWSMDSVSPLTASYEIK